MLRRRLKRGGAPVAACAGFDFDTASAYLEDALVRPERDGYESHLAGCAACRRHLIELSRLAQTVPHTSPAQVADQTPAWSRWRRIVAGWFDLAGWNLKWQMVGAGGAAFAILIAMLSLQSWRQESRQADGAIATNAIPSVSPESPVQTPAPDPSPVGAQFYVAEDPVPADQNSLRASVPQPPPAVGPKEGDANVAVAASSELKLNSPQPSGALQFSFNSKQETFAETQRSSVELPRAPAAQPILVSDSANAGRQAAPGLRDDLRMDAREQAPASLVRDERIEASNDITARITPPPGINPMNSEPKPTVARGKAQAEKTPSRLYGLSRALLPRSKSESEGKAKLEPLDEESFKPLVVRIRDKVFRFEGNMWIDEAYKPGMRWRVLPVTRGSKQYEQILADDPLLKEFFDHGPMIIVWKDKIYKVR